MGGWEDRMMGLIRVKDEGLTGADMRSIAAMIVLVSCENFQRILCMKVEYVDHWMLFCENSSWRGKEMKACNAPTIAEDNWSTKKKRSHMNVCPTIAGYYEGCWQFIIFFEIRGTSSLFSLSSLSLSEASFLPFPHLNFPYYISPNAIPVFGKERTRLLSWACSSCVWFWPYCSGQ